MKTEQCQWSVEKGWVGLSSFGALGSSTQLVFLFGRPGLFAPSDCLAHIRKIYPNAFVFGCSTAGEILGLNVNDGTLALTAVAFEHTQLATASVGIKGPAESFEAGERLARQLTPEGLQHVFVLSEGLKINASEFVNGMNSVLPKGIAVSGGCAGDGNRMQNTHVWCNGEPQESAAVALGFYGERLLVGVSASGGWEPFGPDRLITKSKQNVLFAFDGRPALALYKQYLGQHAEGLPASGLTFPLELQVGGGKERVLRALLGVDEVNQSITYAGNVPEGAYARFMVGHIDGLIEGTLVAAKTSLQGLRTFPSQLSLLVSCNGRRFVLKQRVEEEVEAAQEGLGGRTTLAGFYSYGEIAPAAADGCSELHNETMTITSFAEI
jgi:hypothetical protein